MQVSMEDWESCSGVVTVYYSGNLFGEPPNVSFNGLKECIYVEGETFSECQISKFLSRKGVDVHYVKGLHYKAPNEPMHEFRRMEGNGSILEIVRLIIQHGGVHIYVDQEADFAEVVPEGPLYIRWIEDINMFGGSSKMVVDGYCSLDETDSDLGTPVGNNEEYQRIVGGRWKQKKKAEKEYQEFIEAINKLGRRRRKKKTGVQTAKKSRARRRNDHSSDNDDFDARKKKKMSVKHTPKNKRWGKATENVDAPEDYGEGLVPEQHGSDPGDRDGWQQFGGSGSGWEEHCGGSGFAWEEHGGDPGAGSSQQHSEQVPEAANADETPVRTEEANADETPVRTEAETGISDSSVADKERKRKEKRAETIRRYKTLYRNLNINEAVRKYVRNDEDYEIGDRVCFDGQHRSGQRFQYESSSSDEDEVICFPVVNDPRSAGRSELWYNEAWEVPYFQAGMRFTDHLQFKRALQKYTVVRVAGITSIRNEPKRQTWRCTENCPWRIHASHDSRANCFRVRNYSWEHNCLQEPLNLMATTKYVANHYHSKVRADPSFTCKQMMVNMYSEKGVALGFSKCVRAKTMIVEEMARNFISQYGVVVGYANYLKSINPNNTVVVVSERKTRMPNSPSVFDKMYICLDVLKDGFKKGCRRVIGIDGTHLKGVCKGVLLVAVAKDGNGQMYPLVWAVVDGESHETWSWFLKLLIKDLELGIGADLTILSDKHKGILSAREQLLPYAEHRLCSRHFYGNLRKLFPDAEREGIYWSIVFAYDPRLFQRQMNVLRQTSVQAHDALLTHDVTKWARAFFNPHTRTEDATNNLTETFNGWIRDYRALPIISMFEAISDELMKRRAQFYNSMLVWETETEVCPYPWSRLQRRVQDAHHCNIVWNGQNSFRVADTKYEMVQVVEMIPKTCSCGYWQLTGVPCAHLCRVCTLKGWDPVNFVSEYLKKAMYRLAYERPIECTRGAEAWENYDGPKLEPPVFKRRPGRPRTNRIPSTGEVKRSNTSKFAWIGREGVQMRCGLCTQQGHNTRTCPKLRNNANATHRADTQQPGRNASTETSNQGQAADTQQPGRNANANNQGQAAETNTATETQATETQAADTEQGQTQQEETEQAPTQQAPTQQAQSQQTERQEADDDEVLIQNVHAVDIAAAQRFRRTIRANARRAKKQARKRAATAAANAKHPSSSRKSNQQK